MLWAVPCRKGIIDKFSNEVSLVDVVEAVEIQDAGSEEPASFTVSTEHAHRVLFGGITLATFLERSRADIPERPLCRVQILSPDNSTVEGPETTLDLKTAKRARYFARFPGIPRKGAGIYKFRVQEKAKSGQWKTIGTIELTALLKSVSSSERAQPS